MSLVNFITESRCASQAFFRLNIKNFTDSLTDASGAQTRFRFAAFRFRDVAPEEVRKTPLCAGTTSLLSVFLRTFN